MNTHVLIAYVFIDGHVSFFHGHDLNFQNGRQNYLWLHKYHVVQHKCILAAILKARRIIMSKNG